MALVLAPTRELAEQIMGEIAPFAKAEGHAAVAIYGGVGYGPQKRALDQGVEVVVACPGRLEDLLQMRALDLRDIATVVIDEADQMADMGFLPAVRRIVEKTRSDRQVLLFSATLDGPVAKLVADFQRNPARHEVGPKGPDVHAAQHVFWTVSREERVNTTAEVINRLGSTIVFTRTRHGADRLAKQLGKIGVDAEPIHGGRSQGQRDRALASFKKGSASALIATDVAARGIHVNGVSAVVHFDPPAEDSTYLHRSGRTARAGATGTVVSLLEGSQKKDAMKLQKGIGISEPITEPRFGALVAPAKVARVAPAKAERSDSEDRPERAARTEDRPAGRDRPAHRSSATSARGSCDGPPRRPRRPAVPMRSRQVLQLRPRLWLHHPRWRRQGFVRPLLGDHRRGLQDPRQRRSRGVPGPRRPQRPRSLRRSRRRLTRHFTSRMSVGDRPRRTFSVISCRVRRPGSDREAHPA